MGKRIIGVLSLVLCLFSAAVAREYKVEDVPLVHLQDRTRYVSNPDNLLSPETVSAIDGMLFALEEQTGIQVVVAALTGIEGGDCFDFALRLGQQNGVGQKERDNGLVILLSTDERCVQFVTGYGLEGVMPDAICKRIQVDYMNGYFANGDWNRGMLEGIRAVCGVLDGSMENIGEEDEDLPVVLFACLLSFLFVAVIGVAVWFNTRCPNCGKHNFKRTGSRIIERRQGYIVRENTYRCMDCGHTFTRKEHVEDSSGFGNRGGGVVIGGMGRGFGGSRGGGFGGSFGGGRFGGGGAGSRF